MKATITISMENAAFEDNASSELARILSELAAKLVAGDGSERPLFDINGNRVGMFSVDDE